MLILYQVSSRVVCTVFRKVVADNFVNKAHTIVSLALHLSSIRYIDTRRRKACFLLLLAHDTYDSVRHRNLVTHFNP